MTSFRAAFLMFLSTGWKMASDGEIKFTEADIQSFTEEKTRRRNFAARIHIRFALKLSIPSVHLLCVLKTTNSVCIIMWKCHLILGPIKFLTRLLRKAVEANHRYLGFAARTLAESLTKIAVNDDNKKAVMIFFTSLFNVVIKEVFHELAFLLASLFYHSHPTRAHWIIFNFLLRSLKAELFQFLSKCCKTLKKMKGG